MKKYFLFGFLFLFSLCFVVPGLSSTALAASSQNAACESSAALPANINLTKVRDTWLSWYNAARKKNGLAAYIYSPNLDRTATIWSDLAKQKGSITHKRPGQTLYYDYERMVNWFKGLGLTFPELQGQTFVENIGWDYYSCSASNADCTSNLLASIKSTFNFFMSEKGKKYRPHYDSIMNAAYKKIGLGIAVDPLKKRYYLTVHYGTQVDPSNAAMACLVPVDSKF